MAVKGGTVRARSVFHIASNVTFKNILLGIVRQFRAETATGRLFLLLSERYSA